MKKSIWISVIVIFSAVFFAAFAAHAAVSFPDIKKSPYRESILALAERGIMNGNPDGNFAPAAPLSRAEFTTMISRAFAAGKKIGKKKNCFPDVKKEWFSRFVCFAKAQNLVKGYKDGMFRPAAGVSYMEAVGLSMAAAGLQLLAAAPPEQEGAKKPPWFSGYLNFAHINSILSKFELLPDAPLTREKAAFILHQILLFKEGKKTALKERAQNLSKGCGVSPPANAPVKSIVNGVTRNYITVIPRNYDKNIPKKLVFAFHGRTNSNAMVRGYYKVEEASQGKAIFIYPAGLRSGRGYTWNNPGDFALFDTLLEKFSNEYCIDLDNVYVVGHSLGGWFTSTLGCARGDRIRAFAAIGGGGSNSKICSGPAAAMIWHNPKDNLVSFENGKIARDLAIRQNACSQKTKPVEPRWAKCVKYQGCTDAALFIWCPHTEDYAYWDGSYYPHTWPRHAGEEIWKFFEGLD